jgi:hypothetical protein
MYLGNMAKCGGNLIFPKDEARRLIAQDNVDASLIREFYGSEELINARPRFCLWVEDKQLPKALDNSATVNILERVRKFRSQKDAAPSTQKHANTPHRFVQLSA